MGAKDLFPLATFRQKMDNHLEEKPQEWSAYISVFQCGVSVVVLMVQKLFPNLYTKS